MLKATQSIEAAYRGHQDITDIQNFDYSPAGYGRPEEAKTTPAPAPSHTPTNPPQQPQVPHQGAGYYSNMGYYGNAPYNPYYQCEYLSPPLRPP